MRLRDPFAAGVVALILIAAFALALGAECGGAIFMVLMLLAVALPAQALACANWFWAVARAWIAGVVIFLAALAALALTGADAAMGPGGMIYLLPIMVFPAATAVSGGIRLVWRAVR